MNTVQTTFVSILILAFIASLPGLYFYTEYNTGAEANGNIQRQSSGLKTVDAELPPIPDTSELPETNFNLVEKQQKGMKTGNININTASSRQLQQINGVGPSTANNIISYREQHGKIENFHDLLEISGIGPGTADNFIGEINFGD